jgi:hypothetical protein
MVSTDLDIHFDMVTEARKDEFEKEYRALGEVDSDPISNWVRLKQAKGETKETDEVLLELLVELHRKVDRLEKLIKGEKEQRIELPYHSNILKMGAEYFQLEKSVLEQDAFYYGRVKIRVYPQRDIPFFFRATSNDLAKIVRINFRDENDWVAYFKAMERVMIREMKRSK